MRWNSYVWLVPVAVGSGICQAQTITWHFGFDASSQAEGPGTSCRHARGSVVWDLTTPPYGTWFELQYRSEVMADNDGLFVSCPQRIETLVSDYTVQFTVTAPRLYQLVISTRRKGDLNSRDDG